MKVILGLVGEEESYFFEDVIRVRVELSLLYIEEGDGIYTFRANEVVILNIE